MAEAAARLDPGAVVALSPLVRRILAPNPGPMTGQGTNTYLVGRGEVVVIDPGPDDPLHLDRVAAAGDGRIGSILVTHHHVDHAPGAAGLAERTGAPVLGFGSGAVFTPDRAIGEGFVLTAGGVRLRALHTPGHASDHLCYLLEGDGLLFSGDHVMDGSTVVVAPPDGDMAAYLDGLRRLASLTPSLAAIAPGHGGIISDPAGRLEEYLAHRLARERAIHQALARAGAATVDALVAAVYTDVPAGMHPVARLSLWAHLRKLAADGLATSTDPDDLSAAWRPAP
ncbi:MAG: MBL fold metallo-hydrolase [Acidimicrobiales bacterium]